MSAFGPTHPSLSVDVIHLALLPPLLFPGPTTTLGRIIITPSVSAVSFRASETGGGMHLCSLFREMTKLLPLVSELHYLCCVRKSAAILFGILVLNTRTVHINLPTIRAHRPPLKLGQQPCHLRRPRPSFPRMQMASELSQPARALPLSLRLYGNPFLLRYTGIARLWYRAPLKKPSQVAISVSLRSHQPRSPRSRLPRQQRN